MTIITGSTAGACAATAICPRVRVTGVTSPVHSPHTVAASSGRTQQGWP